MGSSADWRNVISALEARFFCIAPDLPGHGASLALPSGAYSFVGAARAVLGLLDRLEIGRVNLVGYSMGGRLALYLASRHQERCGGLFLESASPGLESGEDREARRRVDEERARRIETDDFERFLRGWYSQPLFASLAGRNDVLEEVIQARLRNDPTELARALRGMGTGTQPSLWGELPRLALPVLTVVGERDERFVGLSRRMAGVVPTARAAVVPGAGHNVRVEAPRAYLGLLEGFLSTSQR